MRIFLTFLLMVFLACCGKPNIPNSYALPERQIQASEVIRKTMIQLKKEKELYPFGTAGCMPNQIKMLGFSFRYYKPVDINKARELLTYSALLFLNEINETEAIRPYLENYPFNPKNIEITIYLHNPDGSEPALEDLTIVKVLGGNLKYLIKNLENNRFTTVYQETFEEAVAKLPEKIAI